MADEIIYVTIEEPQIDPITVTIDETNASLTESLIEMHRQEESPHHAYDDLPDFTLLLENGLL